jgi:hypothetical protein
VLHGHGVHFQREFSFPELRSPLGGRLRFDFAVFDQGKLTHLIEYDGVHHFKPLKHLGGEERFRRQQVNDHCKDQFCFQQNIRLVRIRVSNLKAITIDVLGCENGTSAEASPGSSNPLS